MGGPTAGTGGWVGLTPKIETTGLASRHSHHINCLRRRLIRGFDVATSPFAYMSPPRFESETRHLNNQSQLLVALIGCFCEVHGIIVDWLIGLITKTTQDSS
ncbi:hypothetical protein PIB30_061257 [Stylosanthes scabra]|uniref:Uncharacterized protein n=1 Tax=Stylosanthes scabra TaxID=79078 RepID=A0ABU6ZJG7_9FABA|nr:hypothetical protein [Stylosanthes scabra]